MIKAKKNQVMSIFKQKHLIAKEISDEKSLYKPVETII